MNRDELQLNSFVITLLVSIPVGVYLGYVLFEHFALWQILLMPRSMDFWRWYIVLHHDAYTTVGMVVSFFVVPYLAFLIRRRFLVLRYVRATQSTVPLTVQKWISISDRHDLTWAIASTLAVVVAPIGISLLAGLFAITVVGLPVESFLVVACGALVPVRSFIEEFFTSPELDALVHARSLLDGIRLHN